MLRRVLHHRVYFHMRDTFLLFCDFDCHASFGRAHSSVLSTHARTKCATEIVLISAGERFSPSVCRVIQKMEPFTVWCRQGGISSSAIRKVHQKLRSKVSKL